MRKLSLKIKYMALVLLVTLPFMLPAKPANAFVCSCCTCWCPPICCNPVTTQNIITNVFNRYRTNFIMNSFYRNQFERQGLQPWSDQFRNFITTSGLMIGAFLDGYTENAALTNVGMMNARTIRDYQTSDSICKFGTLSRSLAAADTRATVQQTVLGEIGVTRNLGEALHIAASGRGQDNQSRLRGFVQYFCDLSDNNNGLALLCSSSSPPRSVELNRDADYTRVIDDRDTLNMDLTDNTLTRDEKDVVALGNLLYGHRQFTKRMTESELRTEGGMESYLLRRSVVARRSLAQNSYNAIAAMKAAGNSGSEAYLSAVMTKLGMSPAEIAKYKKGAYIGSSPIANFDDAVPPSYNAQMDVLTKRLYQDPAFYANLMDTKANVKRTSAALEGIGLAQDRDIYKSMARSEMLLAVLLELESHKRGAATQSKINSSYGSE